MPPIIIVTNGVTIISTLVFPETNLPISAATTTAINAPNGSPDPLIINFPCWIRLFVPKLEPKAPRKPTTPDAKTTNLGAFNAYATPIPITGPVSAIAIVDTATRNVATPPLKFIAICFIIRPIISVQNNPSAIPFNATIKYLLNNFDTKLPFFIFNPHLSLFI